MTPVRKIEWSYYAMQFLYWFATGLPMPLLVLLMQARGLDLFQIGIVIGIYSAVIVLLELPTGGLADAIGRKPVTLMAYSFILLYSLILLFAFSFFGFIVAYVVYGIGRALASGALDAWFLDALKASDEHVDIQPRLARATTFVLLGLGLGTLSGGGLATLFAWLPADGTAILTPSAVPVLIALILKVALIGLTAILIDEDRAAYRERGVVLGIRKVPGIIKSGFALARSNAILMLMLGITLVNGLFIIGIENLWQPRFDLLLGDMEGKNAMLGVIMGGTFLVGMIGNLVSSSLGKLMKRRYGLAGFAGQMLKGVALVALALFFSPILAVIAFWMTYFATGLSHSHYGTLVNEEVPSQQRSSMLSIFSLMGFVGSIVGSVMLGYVAEVHSITLAWLISAGIVLTSGLLYLRADQHKQHSEQVS